MSPRAAAVLLALPILAAACTSAADAPQPAPQPAPPPLAPDPYDPDYALSIARHLSIEIGPRPAGEPGELRAAQWLAKTLQELGYHTQLHEFPAVAADPAAVIPADLIAAAAPIAPAVFVQGSPVRRAEGPLVYIDALGAPRDFAATDVDGAIAVVHRGELTFSAKARNAREAGAVALVVVNYDDGPVRAQIVEPVEIPVIIVSRFSDAAIQRARGSPAEIVAPPENPAESPAPTSRNVIAKRPAATCRVYIGAHYDSVPRVPGANDNASGAAILVALARAYAGTRAAAQICFAAFGSEEIGLVGSRALVQELLQNGRLADTRAMLNLDAVGNGTPPIAAIGDPALAARAAALAAQIGIAVHAGAHPEGLASDHVPFQDQDIPVLAFFLPNGILHVPADTFDNLDPDLMAAVGRLAHAALACTLQHVGAQIEPPLPCESAQ